MKTVLLVILMCLAIAGCAKHSDGPTVSSIDTNTAPVVTNPTCSPDQSVLEGYYEALEQQDALIASLQGELVGLDNALAHANEHATDQLEKNKDVVLNKLRKAIAQRSGLYASLSAALECR